MSTTSDQILLGAISIVRNTDSIGIPVFGTPRGNVMYVPEMDGNLKITKFLTFYNKEDYKFDRNVPSDYAHKIFRIRDYAPIPFWINGKCQIVDGGAEPVEIYKKFGELNLRNDVLTDVQSILLKARTGAFIKVEEEHQAREIKSPFSDIFEEDPVHSRYWVSRFSDAVKYVKAQSGPKRVIFNELYEIANQWFIRFGTKTDFKRLLKVVHCLRKIDCDQRYLQSVVFSFLLNKTQNGNFDSIADEVTRENFLEDILPHGIYQFFRENQWIKSPIKYDIHTDLLDPLIVMLNNLEETGNYTNCEKMAYMYFGVVDAPFAIIELARSEIYKLAFMHREYNRELITARNDGFSTQLIREIENDAVKTYRRMMCMEGVIVGQVRLSQQMPAREIMISFEAARRLARNVLVHV